MRHDHPILALCQNLDVSPSGFYDWLKRRTQPGPRARQNQTLAEDLKEMHTRSQQTYGSPRLRNELRLQGRHHGRNRITRLLREQGRCDRPKGRFRVPSQ